MSGFGVRPNQARAQPPSPLRLQSTDGILEFQKIKSTFRSFPWNSQTPWQASSPKGKTTRMEPCEELSGKCPNLPRLLKMLASICRGEMKAWQGMMREDIWGVARCQVLVECMEEEEEKEDAPRMNWGFAQEGVLHTSICHPLFPCRGWIYDSFTVVRQRQISAGMVIWKDNIISWQDFCLECKPPPSEKTTEM